MSEDIKADDNANPHIVLYDADGKKMAQQRPPRVASATWMRSVYRLGKARVGKYDDQGVVGDIIRERLVRAQVPYVVSLLVYHSQFDLVATRREYYVYAPMEVQYAAMLALKLWRRWERGPMPDLLLGDMEDFYPKVDDGAVAEEIDDAEFRTQWNYVRRKKYKAAGDPDDPFAFTCLDQDANLFKSEDFQKGLVITV